MTDTTALTGLLAWEEEMLCARLRLNARAAAQVCGISVRQLGYWHERGLLERDGDGNYGLSALNRTRRIKRALQQGYTLQTAARLVEEQEQGNEADRDKKADRNRGLQERLGALLIAIRVARQSLLALPFAVAELPLAAETATAPAAANQDDARAIALRLNRAVDDLGEALEQLARVREAV